MPSAERISDIVSNALSQYGLGFGNVFYVSSTQTGAADSPGRGLTPETALATIDYAIGRCTASNGDVIVALPGHVETLTAAASVAMDVAGVSIVGVGRGRNRPRFNYTTAAAASLNVTAARCAIYNCVFTAIGVDAVTAAINVSGADFIFADNEMELADATNQAVLGILTAATATRMIIERNFIHGSADAGTATAIRHVAGNDCIIRDNIIWGNYTTSLGGIDNTAAVTGLQIHRNNIANNTASSTKAIVCHASTTADISRNVYRILSGTAPVTCAGGYGAGASYYTAAAGVTAGTLI